MERDNNRQEDFDELPFEWQMRILQMRKNMEEMMPHIDEIANDLANHFLFLDEIENATDAKELNAKLFCAAEKADMEKSYADHTKLCHEWAKEYDWIRHVLKDKGLDGAAMASWAIRKVTAGDFEKAEILKNGLCSHNYEFEKIEGYWRDSMKD